MTSHIRKFFVHCAIFAIVLLFVTGGMFAQSIDPQPADAAQTATTDGSAPQTRIGWSPLSFFDTGYESSVAIHPSGLIVEVHSSGYLGYSGLYYNIGKFVPGTGRVTWGSSHRFVTKSFNGSWPSVAITKEGYVVILWSDAFFKSGSHLRYNTGTLNLDGGTDQLINFKQSNVQYDTGFHNSIAVNYNGNIAEVHESDGGKGIFYRLGHLRAPGAGDFSIVWDSGDKGIKYDNGINPHISMNDNNDVVEVHQVASDDRKLHYIRGKLSSTSINFNTAHPRYHDSGYSPTVVLLNNGYLVETHETGTSSDFRAEYRTGILDPNNSAIVHWSSSTKIADTRETTGLASDGTYALATFGRANNLYYSWAIAP